MTVTLMAEGRCLQRGTQIMNTVMPTKSKGIMTSETGEPVGKWNVKNRHHPIIRMGVHYNVDYANDRHDKLPTHIIDIVHRMSGNTRKILALSVHILDYSRRSDYNY